MSFSVRRLASLLITFLSFAAPLCAQSTAKQTNKAPQGTVSGRVTIKEKGAAGVVVGLRKADMVQPMEPYIKASTDQDGFYRISNVASGSYVITIAAPAFVVPANPSRSKTLILGEDESVEGINFSMVCGGVITGKVTDADERPIIQTQVFLFRSDDLDQQSPQRPVFPATTAQTDDRGVYRIYGLSAGKYKVAAGRSDLGYVGGFAPTRTSYKQVFHPAATEQTKAITIEVSEGSESGNVDISLGRALQTFSVSGKVLDHKSGLPLPNMRLGIQRTMGQGFEFVNTSVASNAQGDFMLDGLIPGKYAVLLMQTQNQNLEMRAETTTFEITDQDVNDLTVRLSRGASLSGVVVLETESKTAFQKLLRMQVRAFVSLPRGANGPNQSSFSQISPDGSFSLGGLPAGNVNMMLASTMGPMQMHGFHIARIERDGLALPRAVGIKDGEQLTGIRMIVVHGTATLRGVVKLENGSLPEGARIFVRLTKSGEPDSMITPPQVDARGHFLMEGLVSGVYELTVSIAGGRPVPPRRVTREVSMQDGVTTDVMITIDLETTPKP